MIEKLSETQTESQRYKIVRKVNELVDAVNELRQQAANHMCRLLVLEHQDEQDDDEATQEAEQIDPYAEQRKWIGKLCWFWDFNRAIATIGVLTDFETDNPQFRKDGMGWYQCCEPVKPDDDIIFKGE